MFEVENDFVGQQKNVLTRGMNGCLGSYVCRWSLSICLIIACWTSKTLTSKTPRQHWIMQKLLCIFWTWNPPVIMAHWKSCTHPHEKSTSTFMVDATEEKNTQQKHLMSKVVGKMYEDLSFPLKPNPKYGRWHKVGHWVIELFKNYILCVESAIYKCDNNAKGNVFRFHVSVLV